MDGVERSLYMVADAAARHSIEVPFVEICNEIDDALKPLLAGLEARIPAGAWLRGGDLVIEASSAEVYGFMAEPNRVLLRFGKFDVAIPDEAAHELLRQLTEKLMPRAGA